MHCKRNVFYHKQQTQMQNLTEEQKEKVMEALELVQEAQDLVDEALEGTGKGANFRAYGRFGFDTLLGNGNRFDSGLNDLLTDEE